MRSVHNDERAGTCPYCGYSAHETNKLKRHIVAKHFEFPRRKCTVPYCNVEFGWRHDFIRHFNHAHLNMRYECIHCKKVSPRAAKLRSAHKCPRGRPCEPQPGDSNVRKLGPDPEAVRDLQGYQDAFPPDPDASRYYDQVVRAGAELRPNEETATDACFSDISLASSENY